MPKEKTIMMVPPGHRVRRDARVDEIRTDEDADRPYLIQETIPEEGETSVDRAFISNDSERTFADERRALKAARDAGDVQAEVDALEKMVDDLCNIVTGKTLDELEVDYPADEEA